MSYSLPTILLLLVLVFGAIVAGSICGSVLGVDTIRLVDIARRRCTHLVVVVAVIIITVQFRFTQIIIFLQLFNSFHFSLYFFDNFIKPIGIEGVEKDAKAPHGRQDHVHGKAANVIVSML